MSKILLVFLTAVVLLSSACKTNGKNGDNPTKLTMNDYVRQGIEAYCLIDSAGVDSIQFFRAVQQYYKTSDYKPLWSDTMNFTPAANDFMAYLKICVSDGLFKEDYHYSSVKHHTELMKSDSIMRTKAAPWVKNDLLLTGAFFHVLQDLSQGRLLPDSVLFINNKKNYDSGFNKYATMLAKGKSLQAVLEAAQPAHKAYWSLKNSSRSFIDSLDYKDYTIVPSPVKDTMKFLKILQKRFGESGYALPELAFRDSATLAQSLIKYQAAHNVKADGKISDALISKLNNTDKNKFLRYAVTLDRYKLLPVKMPEQYVWVNLPSYYLKVYKQDSVQLNSKIIIGKPYTSTPEITSNISDMILYPTWTVPTSIISKEMIPGLKRNPGYLARRGLYLLNSKGQRVDPYTINWNKYSKGLPFAVQQGSGDNNALGVMKFNFKNAYSVYLHDTNQRYLFNNSKRALSHGCVRVEQWQELAHYIARNDSIQQKTNEPLKYTADSIDSWLSVRKMHKIEVKNQIPLFIAYFGCDFNNGSLIFYEDIYKEDQNKINQYFSRKHFSL